MEKSSTASSSLSDNFLKEKIQLFSFFFCFTIFGKVAIKRDGNRVWNGKICTRARGLSSRSNSLIMLFPEPAELSAKAK
jgi:hypothetical protein